ncbi:17149_t:CDS:2, partial [Cetraspora pellucida]
ILQYEGAPNDAFPTSKKVDDDWSKNLFPCRDLDVDLIKPYMAVEPPQIVTDQINVSVTLHGDDKNTTKAYINNQSWVPDITNPSIMKIMAQNISATAFPINANAYAYDTEGGAVEIVLFNKNGADHPFHLHGHNFFIIGISSAEKHPVISKYNLVDPPLRDTLTVPANGWAVIRYIINNPGVWAFHCHIEWHVELGMVFQLIEQQDKIRQLKLPDTVAGLCKEGYQNTRRIAHSSPDEDVTITGRGRVSVKRKSLQFAKKKRFGSFEKNQSTLASIDHNKGMGQGIIKFGTVSGQS